MTPAVRIPQYLPCSNPKNARRVRDESVFLLRMCLRIKIREVGPSCGAYRGGAHFALRLLAGLGELRVVAFKRDDDPVLVLP